MQEYAGHTITLPEERLVELITSTGLSIRLACSPNNLAELTTGWLFGQRLIGGINDIVSLQVCDEGVRILVQLRSDLPQTLGSFVPVVTSGCTGGIANLEQYRIQPDVCSSALVVSLHSVREALSRMFEWLHREAVDGGVHSAALSPVGDGPMLAAADIGRHNAVDKVVGMGLRSKLDFGSHILVTSGRISSDILFKAARAGIPIVATARSATSLAASLSEAAEITLVCRLGKATPLVLGNTKRIQG